MAATDDILRWNFVNGRSCFLVKILLKVVPKRPIDSNSALVKIMDWRRLDKKPLSELMLNQFTKALGGDELSKVQYIPRNMHTVFALLGFVVVILIFPYPSGLLHWHCGNLTIAPVPAKQPWWIWINTSYKFIMNDCITTTKQSTTKPCAYFLGYTVEYRSGIGFPKTADISLHRGELWNVYYEYYILEAINCVN